MAPLLAAIIMSNTSSYSSTGGNYAGPGGVVSNGAVESSAYSETNVGGSESDYYSSDNDVDVTNGEGGGTATVHVETDNNGQVQQETVTKPIPAGGTLDIEVATSSASGNSSVRIGASVSAGSPSTSLSSLQRAIHHLLQAASSSATSSASVSASTTEVAFSQISFGAQLTAFLERLFSLFGL